ncbi:helix-turn-helix domain-containing protein [Promicromonospora vindobonensis]|uniref:Helix-turn-helix domain-containing protein n=1 Tax=Promicromonospora vindobonensis TaxID=195748 RepID=A0ABW5VPN7_9MICO
MKRPVDPRFGAELRRLREARAMSLRELSAVAHLSKSLLSLYENGSRLPSPENAAHLDKMLGVGGRLASLTPDPMLGNEATPNGMTPGGLTPSDLEQAERVAHAERVPRALDGGAVESLGGVLAAHRRLDDTVPAEVLWPIASTHHQMLVRVAGEARGPHVPALHLVVAESLQFVGWLSAQRGQYEMADRMYAQSADRAEELGAGGLASQSRRFRGSLAWEQVRLAQMVAHYAHAAQTPGAGILHRIDAGLRHAHALALLGDPAGALRALHVASDLTTAADGAAPDPFAYWLTNSWLRFPLGLAHLELGRAQDAADNLRAGLADLPDQQRDTPWTAQYRSALETAQARA